MNPLEDYSPLDLLRRPLTIFNAEIKRIRWKHELPNLRKADWARVWVVIRIIVVMIILTVVGSTVDRPTSWYLSWFGIGITFAMIFLVPWLVGIVADLYTASSTITFWHARAKEETLDILRLTMPDDSDLLNSLRAASEVMAWRGMRWETATRAFLAICVILACGGATAVLIVNIYLAKDTRDFNAFFFSASVVAWSVRVFLMYLQEPLWRMRTLVALGIAVASRTRDTYNAVLIASGIAMCLKLIQFTVAVLLTIVTLNTFNLRGHGIMPTVLFGVGSIAVPWLVRRAYRAVHAWCTRLTLLVMRGGTD